MGAHILITGGAGFIGSHLADELIDRGYRVRIVDSLLPQVHGHAARRPPDYLSSEAEFILGDVRSADTMARALDGIDAVCHLAARVGVGQSMYEVEEYTSVNNFGTAVLFQHLIRHPVDRVVVASSMSLYGEGLYRAADGSIVGGAMRKVSQLRTGDWELRKDGEPLDPMPTPEWKPPALASVYALSKFDQEKLALMLGEAYSIPTVALRFFNVYGTRQALSNPYTGVLAIFASRLLNGLPPLLFEDGRQMRDFVSVRDVVQACCLALERPAEAIAGKAINVGSGGARRVLDVAENLADILSVRIAPFVSGRARVGDIRHCFADITLARELLGYSPKISFRDGLVELSHWLLEQEAADHASRASRELEERGLTL